MACSLAVLALAAAALQPSIAHNHQGEHKRAVMFSYHDLSYEKSGKMNGNWLKSMGPNAKNIRAFHPDKDFDIVLVTNVEEAKELETADLFDNVIVADCQPPAPLRKLVGREVKASKSVAMRKTFEIGGYEELVFLDFDARVVRNGLAEFMAPLKYYDVAGVMVGYPTGPGNKTTLGGWEFNTGGIAMRRSVIPLLKEWTEEFVSDAKYGKFSSIDQNAFMAVLQRNKNYRFFPLPGFLFNLRPFSISPAIGTSMFTPVISQYDDKEEGTPCDKLVGIYDKARILAETEMRPQCNKIHEAAGFKQM